MLLSLSDRLALRNWQSVLYYKRPYKVKSGWVSEISTNGITIDLSKVRRVEPCAVVRVVLFIEAALIGSINVTVRLPLREPTHAESSLLRSAESSEDANIKKKASYISRYVERRAEALAVLEHMRFRQALASPHLARLPGKLTLNDQFDWSAEEMDEEAENQVPEGDAEGHVDLSWDEAAPWYFQTVFPLQWIEAPREPGGKQLIEHLAQLDILADIVQHPSGRIDPPDGRTLAHFFLKELAENATDYADRRYALVTAWSRPSGMNIQPDEVMECERSFAEWCKGIPIVELIVGDSGVGIPATLGNPFRRHGREGVLQALHGYEHDSEVRLPDWHENDRILAWAFDKYSSSKPLDMQKGTRGLYRVARVVRKYNGCVSIQSERSFVCIDSSRGSSQPDRHSGQLARMPGTVVHVRLPVMLVEHKPVSMFEPLRQVQFRVLDFAKLVHPREFINWDRPEEACALITQQVERECRQLSVNSLPACVIIDLGFANIERRILEKLLLLLMQVAHPVALSVANVRSPDWDSCVETINSLEQEFEDRDDTISTSESDRKREALLFIHADGRHAWVGAPSHPLLKSLWETGQLEFSDLMKQGLDKEEISKMIRQCKDIDHILVVANQNVRLLFNQMDISDHLRKHLIGTIRHLIGTGGPGIIQGQWFRTPSLEFVSRFIHVERLIKHLGLERCMFALAKCCIADGLLKDTNENIKLVAGWQTSLAMLEAFRRGLASMLGRNLNITIEQIGPYDIPTVAAPSNVLIFTDLISSGDLVARLQGQLMRAQSRATAVVCLIDARRTVRKETTEAMVPASICSLLCIPTEGMPSDITHVINISPSDPYPEDARNTINHYVISSARLHDMIQQTDALYSGHIVRPNGRHFCLYLDAAKLIGASDTLDADSLSSIGEEILGVFISQIDTWLLKDESLDLIFFPHSPQSENPSAAKIIAGKLGTHYGTPLCAISPGRKIISAQLPRKPKTRPSSDLFEEDEPIKLDSVAIVDWGVLTGKNIRDLVNSAVTVGAKRVLAVIFLNQFGLGDDAGLPREFTVETWGDSKLATPCTVSIIYLARFPIVSYDALHCPYCRQLSRLQTEERYCPSPLLRQYIESARRRLAPRNLLDARHEHYQNQRNAVSWGTERHHPILMMAEFREQIENARRYTGERALLWERLERLVNGGKWSDATQSMMSVALMRLLANEWTLLKDEPLTLLKIRRTVAELAIQAIMDRNLLDEERQEAIVVLRTISKDAFATHLEELFQALLPNEHLVAQLLYCTYTYLQRDYLFSERLYPLVTALKQCADYADVILPLSGPATLSIGQAVHALYHYGIYALKVQATGKYSKVQAWNLLNSEFDSNYHIHHPVCEAFNDLFFGPLEPVEGGQPSIVLAEQPWELLREGWKRTCEHHIAEKILPLVRIVRSMTESTDASLMLGKASAEALARFAEGKGFVELATLALSIDRFAQDRRGLRGEEWRSYVQSRNWLWDLLIDPGTINELAVREGGCTLLKFLKGCPSDLGKVAREAIHQYELKGQLSFPVKRIIERPAIVFCHEHVVFACLSELLDNIVKHNKAKNANGDRIEVAYSISHSAEYVWFSLRNRGDFLQVAGGGRGLQTLRSRLQNYDAIVALEEPNADWTFGITIRFLRGDNNAPHQMLIS